MDEQTIYSLITLAFGLGLIHALDADHIMAVSSLMSSGRSIKHSLRFCAHWAIGHGVVIVIMGCTVMLLGASIPQQMSQTAEWLIGVILISLGAWTLWDLYQNRKHLHFHQHDRLPPHAHWHQHKPQADHYQNKLFSGKGPQVSNIGQDRLHNHSHQATHKHGALAIGSMHGLAGSAPILALLPLSQSLSPWHGMVYLVTFVFAVLIAMLIFGGLFSHSLKWLGRKNQRYVGFIRLLVSALCISIGIQLLPGV